MSDARLMQILASLARRSPLRTLHTICETQHQISTRKLEQYLEPIGDELAGFAFNLRQDYDQLHAANQRLEGEVERLTLAIANQTVRRFVGDDDQRQMDELVAAGIRADQQEIKRLREAVREFAGFFSSDDPKHWELHGLADGADYSSALSTTANGEVTE